MSQGLGKHLGIESLRAKRSNLFCGQRLLRRFQLLAMTLTPTFQPALKVGFLLITLIVIMLASLAFAQPVKKYQPVTNARLLQPEPQNWLMYRGTYDSWGYSSTEANQH